MNDRQQFSVELLCTSAASGRRFGFTPRPTRKRPNADTRAVESVRIAAPVGATWAAITHHENMGEWIDHGSVSRTVDGAPERNGRGSDRLLKLPNAASQNTCWPANRRPHTDTA